VKDRAFVEFEPKRVVMLDCYSAREILRSSKSNSFTVLANLGPKGSTSGQRALGPSLVGSLST
jgi:hypothetical protein